MRSWGFGIIISVVGSERREERFRFRVWDVGRNSSGFREKDRQMKRHRVTGGGGRGGGPFCWRVRPWMQMTEAPAARACQYRPRANQGQRQTRAIDKQGPETKKRPETNQGQRRLFLCPPGRQPKRTAETPWTGCEGCGCRRRRGGDEAVRRGQSSKLRGWRVEFSIRGSGIRVQDSGFRDKRRGLLFQNLRFRVAGLGFVI